MSPQHFATCLNCIDGRVQQPVADWIKREYIIDYVDMITAPGMDGVLAKPGQIDPSIIHKINASMDHHNTHHIFIVGHEDCAENPSTDEMHKDHIRVAIDKINRSFALMKIIGLWVALDGAVTVIDDNH